MACLTDLVNLNLSDTTEKIIAEYIWYGARFRRPPSHGVSPVRERGWERGSGSVFFS
jgi:hypothetical protein